MDKSNPVFINVGETHQLCRFPMTGQWSLRLKLLGQDITHVRYLSCFEVLMVEAALNEPRSESRSTVIEEVAKEIESAPLTYAGPDPHVVSDLRYLIVCAIRDMKGEK